MHPVSSFPFEPTHQGNSNMPSLEVVLSKGYELPQPFKVKKPNEIKIAALQLPVMDGGKIHCLDVLYALTKRLLGEIEVNLVKVIKGEHVS